MPSQTLQRYLKGRKWGTIFDCLYFKVTCAQLVLQMYVGYCVTWSCLYESVVNMHTYVNNTIRVVSTTDYIWQQFLIYEILKITRIYKCQQYKGSIEYGFRNIRSVYYIWKGLVEENRKWDLIVTKYIFCLHNSSQFPIYIAIFVKLGFDNSKSSLVLMLRLSWGFVIHDESFLEHNKIVLKVFLRSKMW